MRFQKCQLGYLIPAQAIGSLLFKFVLARPDQPQNSLFVFFSILIDEKQSVCENSIIDSSKPLVQQAVNVNSFSIKGEY